MSLEHNRNTAVSVLMKHTEKVGHPTAALQNQKSAHLHYQTLHFVLEVNPSPIQLTKHEPTNGAYRAHTDQHPTDTKAIDCCGIVL